MAKVAKNTKEKAPARTAMRRRNLLIELGTEELPPKALKKLGNAFADRLFEGLVEAGVVDQGTSYQYYATPRRLAVWVKSVAPKQPDRVEERKGPALQAAYDSESQPTKAAMGFARSCGVEVSDLEVAKTDKGAWLVFQKSVPGESLSQVVDQCLAASIKQLPIPKRMRWGDSNIEFVRPVHWLLCLYGADVLPSRVLGLKASRNSRGHRFHSSGDISIPSADRYVATLKTAGMVIVDYAARQALIEKQVQRLALKAEANVVVEPDLLDLVTGLVEWPQAILGEFDSRFLTVPSEVLISSMSDHQKYFHLVDEKGKLLPMFITVSNIKSKSPKRVRQGNERVLRARLSDAEFFWKSDQEVLLIDRLDSLKRVLFHRKLGSIHAKSQRLELLGQYIVQQLGNDVETHLPLVSRASMLCKADLVTDMVGEFPELQGVVGRYYALKQGEKKQVAQAIDGHYMPRFAGDDLPKDVVSQNLALADRIDTLVGIFASGEIPTGDKDPFGLRRAALGVIRIMVEKKLDLDLLLLIGKGVDNYRLNSDLPVENPDAVCQQVFDFVLERLNAYYQGQGFGGDEISAVLACRPTNLLDFDRRLHALNKFFNKRKSAAQSLAAANKRIANILAKSAKNMDIEGKQIDKTLVGEGAERALFDTLMTVEGEVDEYFSTRKYDKAFEVLASLKDPVDAFFDSVMVMDPDDGIRQNRLAILASLRRLFLEAADISVIRHD